MDAVHFRTPNDFRRWLEANHATATELWVGFWRRDSGEGGITYPEALDEALCFGWIDGVRYKVDGRRYTIRFSPRRPRSRWSAVNLRRFRELVRQDRVPVPGMVVFEARHPECSRLAAEERADVKFPPDLLRRFRASPEAFAFFEGRAPWYRRTVTRWVASAKREETRLRRMDTLIADSAAGRRLNLLSPGSGREG